MVTGIGIGFIFLAIGCTFWKLGFARKLTPYILLLGGSVLVGSSVMGFAQRIFGVGSGWVSDLLGHVGMSIGGGTIMLTVSIVLGIVLWHGLHPKKGSFEKKHNVLALITAFVWGATGGFFGSIISGLATLAHNAGNMMNTLGG